MTSKTLLKTISELKDDIEKYLTTKISYYGLTAFEKIVKVIQAFVSRSVVFLIFVISLLFLSTAVALYVGKAMQSYELGLLIVGGFYFLLGVVLYLFRERIFGRCIIRTLVNIFFKKEDEQ